MHLQNEKNTVVNLVLHCTHCQPLSGCILADYKGKNSSEIRGCLSKLSDAAFERLLSFHETCPYRNRLVI